MHGSGDFVSPGRHEYANVRALNTAWLLATTDLKGPQRGRMGSVPFLLFSVHEQDLGWWDEALSDSSQGDLLKRVPATSAELAAVQAAALGFLWQLLQANPYAARVISGASIAWCDRLVDLPLISLLEKVAWRGDLTAPRTCISESGNSLLQRITSSEQTVRSASQRVALQRLLTNVDSEDYAVLPTAACAMPRPFGLAKQVTATCKKV